MAHILPMLRHALLCGAPSDLAALLLPCFVASATDNWMGPVFASLRKPAALRQRLGHGQTLPSSRATKFKVAPSAIKKGAIWAAAGADDFFVGEFWSFCCRIIRHACS